MSKRSKKSAPTAAPAAPAPVALSVLNETQAVALSLMDANVRAKQYEVLCSQLQQTVTELTAQVKVLMAKKPDDKTTPEA